MASTIQSELLFLIYFLVFISRVDFLILLSIGTVLQKMYFPVNFAKCLRTPILYKDHKQLHLKF